MKIILLVYAIGLVAFFIYFARDVVKKTDLANIKTSDVLAAALASAMWPLVIGIAAIQVVFAVIVLDLVLGKRK